VQVVLLALAIAVNLQRRSRSLDRVMVVSSAVAIAVNSIQASGTTLGGNVDNSLLRTHDRFTATA
jgi:hypothetical protein